MDRLKKAIIFLVVAAFLSAAPAYFEPVSGISSAYAEEPSAIADAFLNEELTYSLGFWFLEDVALGRVNLTKGENGEYTATLYAYTTGVVDEMLRHRRDKYVSRLKLAEGGKRFVTLSFEKTLESYAGVKKTLTAFDYEKGVMTWKRWKNGKLEKTGEEPLQEGVYYDDPIAGFYNLRFGVYGAIEKGREYRINTFPKEGRVPQIRVIMAADEEMDKRIEGNSGAGFLADVKLDKELFGSKAGDIVIFFTGDMLPVSAIAKDILFFGDVTGKLKTAGEAKTSASVTGE